MLYSIRMRAAENGAHENGGRHISGAERLVSLDELQATASAMLYRAFTHSRGQADFVNLKIEAISRRQIIEVPLLPLSAVTSHSIEAGRNAAINALIAAGVSPQAARQGMAMLTGLSDSMRGALLVCGETGKRLDNTGARGIRVSRMDIAEEAGFTAWLDSNNLNNIHIREALVLAAKVASAPDIAAELCWSDDPDYTTGYIATKAQYIRIPNLKPLGSPVGGRVFFIVPGSDIDSLITYLEKQPVLVKTPNPGGGSCAVCSGLS